MHGIEIYDLWLRTGHSDPLDWIEFMCEAGGHMLHQNLTIMQQTIFS